MKRYIPFLCIPLAVAAVSIATTNYFANEAKYRDRLLAELIPIVEQVDGKPGISFEDQVDFAKRAGINRDIPPCSL